MVDFQTPQGGTIGIADAPIAALRESLRGSLLLPEDAGYDAARSLWNAMIDRRPAAIVRAAGAADVMKAVNFAREHKLLLAVKGAGHNIAGKAACDGGLMLDLSAMKSVRVDPVARMARVEPGALLSDFDRETQAFGLSTPTGINSTTGMAGLTLGGGFGWQSRKRGLTIDNLQSVDMVLASGELVQASATQNPDLFWAVRGGGGNFGVVTSFEYRLHPLGPQVLAGLIVYPFAQARQVFDGYRKFTATASDDMTAWMVMRKAPPLPFLPAEVHGKEVIVVAFCWIGEPAQGEAMAQTLRSFGTPAGEHVGPMPFAGWQTAFDPLLQPGARNYWKSHNLANIDDGLIDALLQSIENLPSPQCEIFFGQIGAQTQRVPVNATAYSSRDTQYAMNVHGRWEDPADDERCIAWARAFFEQAAPFSLGSVYVNFMTQEEAGRVADAYGPNFERLVAVKSRYDPHNLFRHNQNIRPAM